MYNSEASKGDEMNETDYKAPTPILDQKEQRLIEDATKRYEKMIKPGIAKRAAANVAKHLPEGIKDAAGEIKDKLTEVQIYAQAMSVVSDGFKAVEEQAARFTVNESTVIESVDKVVPDNDIKAIDEICLARAYDVTKLVEAFKAKNLALAAAEGAATGAPGFPGIPFNLVLSTFIYYRAVQSVAMYYGYDIKGNPDEMIIAGEVFSSAMSPSNAGSETSGSIAKVMVVCEVAGIGAAAKKGWAAMVARGGGALAIAQMRALAHKAAQNALQKAGAKGLENSIFKTIFEQIGKRLALKTVQNAVPVISAAFCALFDTATMKQVIDFAQVFYSKRFLLEKEMRINELLGETQPFVIEDVEVLE